MQTDSISLTSSQAPTQESSIKSFQCRHCTLILKSKVYLFEHLNEVHGFDVDAALRNAGLKSPVPNKTNADNDSSSSGDHFHCQHCDFKACSWDILNEHEKQCPKKHDDQSEIENVIISENPETQKTIVLTNQHKEATGAKDISSVSSVMSTSKKKCTLNSSKDLKTYKRPLQTITKYFEVSSGSNGKPPVKLADSSLILDSTKGTLLLQESPSASTKSSGVLKVTAKPTIDITKNTGDRFLLNDHLLISDLRPSKAKKQFDGAVDNNTGKTTDTEISKNPPAKKAKTNTEETALPNKANVSKQQSSSGTEFPFEFSEDEEEMMVNLIKEDMESPKVYFCKHCDYSDVGIRNMSTHYQNDHPYVRYHIVYIQDPSDKSATFRCLECPVEFSTVAGLKRHYTENHPEAPNVFQMQSSELRLVFKCFVCPFTTSTPKALKEHYKETHPTHGGENTLMYCRYLANACQAGSSQLNTCEKARSPERPEEVSAESAQTPFKEDKNAHSLQHATSNRADVALYHCNNCKFSHKSVIVMHVHYQKSHPDEAVTIDKIKQSAHVTPCTTAQMTPEKSPNSVKIVEESTPPENLLDSSKKARNKEELLQKNKISLSMRNPATTKAHSDSPKTRKVERKFPIKRNTKVSAAMNRLSYRSPNKLFYCQYCSYSSTFIKSVVGHHNAKHAVNALTSTEEISWYSAQVEKRLKREAQTSASATPPASKICKRDERVEEDLQHEEAEAADIFSTDHHTYAHAENLFYCQRCNYANPTVKGVLNHQARTHHCINSNRECIIEHSNLIRDEIEKSKSQGKETPSLPLPLLNDGDEDAFFCHLCNYRQRTIEQVVRHYFKKHHGFVVKADQIRLHTSEVLKHAQKSHIKIAANTNQEVNHASLGKNEDKEKKTKKVSASCAVTASQTQRTLQCPRCLYSTQNVYLLRRHLGKIHKANRTVTDILRMCFKQGALQAGFHCDLCVFSHEKAEAVHKHYQEQHPGRRPSLEYVTTRLYVGPEMEISHPKKKKPQIKHTDYICDSDDTDGSSPSQRPGQNETKIYSCRACPFKSSSMSGITHHYRVIHPWSVKDDGSVLDVINSKKLSTNRQVDDQNEMSGSIDTYQEPLEFDNSSGSSHEAAVSSSMLKCRFCPLRFHTQRGLSTHCGMKHQEAVAELDEVQEEKEQIQKRIHLFKCPHCSYVNTSYHGVLTHCQMRHPTLVSRADSLHVDEADVNNWEECVKRPGPGLRLSGYMCKTCPQIYATLDKLIEHCRSSHDGTVAETVANMVKQVLRPSAVSKIKQSKIRNNQAQVSKASFLCKKMYSVIKCQQCAYSCSTKIALDRHVRVCHKNAPVAKDCLFRCALCSNSYFRRHRLGSHYAKKHGKEAFLKYYVPLCKQVHKKPAPDSSDHPQQNTPSMTTEEKKISVYKCPSCPYLNSSYHGVLTHCQMTHPDVIARADQLETGEILVTNMVGCKMGKASNERGYECKICPQIHASLKKLKIHYKKDHSQTEGTASPHSVETETEKQPEHVSQLSVLEAFSLINKTSEVSTSEAGELMASPETMDTPLRQKKDSPYKCHMCTYSGWCRRYLHCHYKKTHKLDAFTVYKLLEKYNKRNRNKARNLPEPCLNPSPEFDENAPIKCKVCPDLVFDSSELLIAHYSTFHSTHCASDFIVLSRGSKNTTGLYKCAFCSKQMNGTRKLSYHLDQHRENAKNKEKSDCITTTPEDTSVELSRKDELPTFETVEELAQWNVPPAATLTLPPSPLSSPAKPTDPEQQDPDSRAHCCQQCGQTFMSLKGLRSHERSHAALAAIKKINNLPTSALKHKIDKYVVYKPGTMRPFLCGFCTFRTTVMGLWRRHFMKKHQDIVCSPETDSQDEESDKEHPNTLEDLNNLFGLDEERGFTEKSLYSEPPDVQRQLNHYSLMAKARSASTANVQKDKSPKTDMLHCERCNFNTGNLSRMRRHYLTRHGKKILRCKECSFFTGSRKTLGVHVETDHSTFQSGAAHQKDFRCPFCLYQTKNKNNMIDHIVLHREERVVPIEVRRPKLSRYLQGIVFRCHKCTFTSGSAENLRSHMARHRDIKPYKCRLCYFDCTWLSDLETHLSDKHQVERNHELVGQVSLDQLEARVGGRPDQEEEPLTSDNREVVKTEEFVKDCNEVQRETHGQTLADNDTQETDEEQIMEMLRNDSAPDATVEQVMENVMDHNAGESSNTDIQSEDHDGPEKEWETNESNAQPKLGESEDTRDVSTQQKVEAAEGSSTACSKIAERVQAHKLHIEALQHKTLNIEHRVEDDILHHIPLLDKDGSICKTHKKENQDRTVKKEQNMETEVMDNVPNEILLLDDWIHNPKNQVNTKTISATTKTNHRQASNNKAQESFTVERHLLTLTPNCGQLKMSHKEILGVANCKQEHNHETSEKVSDPYEDMPVLENEYLKEEMHPLGSSEEEDQNDRLEQNQDKEDEMITDKNENGHTNHEEVDEIKAAEDQHVPKNTGGAAGVQCPLTTAEKLFTCELCGRNLMSSSDLERHIMRHGR